MLRGHYGIKAKSRPGTTCLEEGFMAKEKFERTKPHVNIGAFFNVIEEIPEVIATPAITPAKTPVSISFFALSLNNALFILFNFNSICIFHLILCNI